jgi:hypothetical protein
MSPIDTPDCFVGVGAPLEQFMSSSLQSFVALGKLLVSVADKTLISWKLLKDSFLGDLHWSNSWATQL